MQTCKAICIIAYALSGLTARQLLNSSTLLDSSTELDRARQSSTPRRMQSASTCLDGLDKYSTALLDSYSTRLLETELLDSYSTGSTGKALTAPRQRPRQRLDGASTARQLDSQGSSRRRRAERRRRRAGRGGAHSQCAVARSVRYSGREMARFVNSSMILPAAPNHD